MGAKDAFYCQSAKIMAGEIVTISVTPTCRFQVFLSGLPILSSPDFHLRYTP